MDRESYLNYAASGFHIERALLSLEEASTLRDHFMAVNAGGARPGDFAGVQARSGSNLPDPLAKYPRLIQMHEWDPISSEWMQASQLVDIVEELMGQPPELLQTMVYFKPPGSRGQSFHQDNLYLRSTPVVAAWVALDACDGQNGAMEMVVGSHLLGLLPCRLADTDVSFTDSETIFPTYLERRLISLQPGDAVFFNGLTVHGSMPNITKDRFRRSFIVHYQGSIRFPIVGPDLPKMEVK